MYVLSVVDRTNIAMAIPAMRSELGISASAIGFATGVFFWGYIIRQIPAGRLAAVWSVKWVIVGLLMICRHQQSEPADRPSSTCGVNNDRLRAGIRAAKRRFWQ
jgi:MFS family permease